MKRVIAILGMHRSGTSCLAGTLESYGLHLGSVKTSSPYNKKGNRENPDIFGFHEKILTDNGGSWNNPPIHIHWQKSHTKILLSVLEAYEEFDLWGFKDPRTVFVIENWFEVFKDKLEFKLVGSFRHPLLVAASLNRRNGMSIEKGLELWFKYNSKLLELCEKYPIDLIDFDRDEKGYIDIVNQIAIKNGLDIKKSENQFYEPNLIGVNDDVAFEYEIPNKITLLYKSLKSYEYR